MKRAHSPSSSNPASAKRQRRPRDVIGDAVSPTGRLSKCRGFTDRLVFSMSPEDLLGRCVTRAVLWQPDRCIASVRQRVDSILLGSDDPFTNSSADNAAFQYFAGGPNAVKQWDKLDSRWQRLTRSELGFVRVPASSCDVLMISDDDQEEVLMGDDDEEEEEEEEVLVDDDADDDSDDDDEDHDVSV